MDICEDLLSIQFYLRVRVFTPGRKEVWLFHQLIETFIPQPTFRYRLGNVTGALSEQI